MYNKIKMKRVFGSLVKTTTERQKIMKNFSERLIAVMKERGIRAAELSRMTGLSKARISQYTSGTYFPKPDALHKIASALDVSYTYLLGYTIEQEREEVCGVSAFKPYKTLPLIGEIACGVPMLAENDFENSMVVDSSLEADYCLVARGDSMKNARIFDGDLVFVAKCESVKNGEIAAVIIDDETTLKRVYYYPEEQKLILTPENPNYVPLVFIGSELEKVHILGRAVAFRAKIS